MIEKKQIKGKIKKFAQSLEQSPMMRPRHGMSAARSLLSRRILTYFVAAASFYIVAATLSGSILKGK